jgi:hypothetical protein
MLFILSIAYACSGYVIWIYQLLTRKSPGGRPPAAPAAPEH